MPVEKAGRGARHGSKTPYNQTHKATSSNPYRQNPPNSVTGSATSGRQGTPRRPNAPRLRDSITQPDPRKLPSPSLSRSRPQSRLAFDERESLSRSRTPSPARQASRHLTVLDQNSPRRRATSENNDRMDLQDAWNKTQQVLLERDEEIENLQEQLAFAAGQQKLRSTTKKSGERKEESSIAVLAGKLFAAGYCMYPDVKLVFPRVSEGANTDDEFIDNYDIDNTNEHEVEGAPPLADNDLLSAAGRAAYTKEACNTFKAEHPELIEGWGTTAYRRDFKNGLNKIRRDLLTGISEHPEKVFDISVTDQDWNGRNRATSKEVESFLTQKALFQGDERVDSQDAEVRALTPLFRHRSILCFLRRMFLGPSALLSGKKSTMANNSFKKKWRLDSLSLPFISFSATMLFITLLNGEPNKPNARIQTYYYTSLKVLFGMESKHQDIAASLISYYNRELGFTEQEEEASDPIPGAENILNMLY